MDPEVNTKINYKQIYLALTVLETFCFVILQAKKNFFVSLLEHVYIYAYDHSATSNQNLSS